MVLQEMMRRACFFISHHVSIQREGDCPANQEPIRARTGVFVGTLIWNYPAYKHVGNKFCLRTPSQRVCLLVLYCYSLNIKCPLQTLVCILESQLNCYFERFRTYEEVRCSWGRLVTRSRTFRVYYLWLVCVSLSLFFNIHKVNSSASYVICSHCSNALVHYWSATSRTKWSLMETSETMS